jgi:hypothetical protein
MDFGILSHKSQSTSSLFFSRWSTSLHTVFTILCYHAIMNYAAMADKTRCDLHDFIDICLYSFVCRKTVSDDSAVRPLIQAVRLYTGKER